MILNYLHIDWFNMSSSQKKIGILDTLNDRAKTYQGRGDPGGKEKEKKNFSGKGSENEGTEVHELQLDRFQT